MSLLEGVGVGFRRGKRMEDPVDLPITVTRSNSVLWRGSESGGLMCRVTNSNALKAFGVHVFLNTTHLRAKLRALEVLLSILAEKIKVQ